MCCEQCSFPGVPVKLPGHAGPGAALSRGRGCKSAPSSQQPPRCSGSGSLVPRAQAQHQLWTLALALLPARLFVLWSSLKPTRSPSSLASQGHWLCSVGHGLCSGVAGLGGFQVFLVRLSGREGSKATPAVGRALEQLPARVGAPAAACQPAFHSVLWSLPPSGLRR